MSILDVLFVAFLNTLKTQNGSHAHLWVGLNIHKMWLLSRSLCYIFDACRKGISDSALPYRRSAPSWLKVNPNDVSESVCKLAKKGHTPSQIGVILRDLHGIAQTKNVTGNKILRILKANGTIVLLACIYMLTNAFCFLRRPCT